MSGTLRIARACILVADTWVCNPVQGESDAKHKEINEIFPLDFDDKSGIAFYHLPDKFWRFRATKKKVGWSPNPHSKKKKEFVSVNQTESDFWIDKIESTYVCYPDTFLKYVSWSAVHELKQEAIEKIVTCSKKDRVNFWHQIESLLDVFPVHPNYTSIRPKENPKITSLFLIEMTGSSINDIQQGSLDIDYESQAMLEFFGFPKTWNPTPLPFILHFHGLSLASYHQDSTMVNLCYASSKDPMTIELPQMAFDMLEYMRLRQLLRYFQQTIRNVSLSANGAGAYVNHIRKGNTLENYLGKFLEDRITINNDLSDIRASLQFFEESFNKSCLMHYWRKGSTEIIEEFYSNGRFCQKWTPLEKRLLNELQTEVYQVKYDAEVLAQNEQWVSDYLRDRANVDVALTNLKLQRVMVWLTVIALFAALTSTLASLVVIIESETIDNLINTIVLWSFDWVIRVFY